MAIPIIPIIQAITGIGSLVSGMKAQSMSDEAIQKMLQLSEEEMKEVRALRAILSDPNNPVRSILMEQAQRGIAGQVTRGQQDLTSRLASMGWKDAGTLAGPLSTIASSGVRAAGELGRQSLVDFLQQRINLVGRGTAASGGLLSGVAGISGANAQGAGESLGSLLALLTRNQYGPGSAVGNYPGYNPYGGTAGRVRGAITGGGGSGGLYP